ncbi:hypothetical protein [Polaromonas sp.]|uniref:hypothetical protein n=1 Tax=Polaromonas sp. TaxID=1869339 RepID=UPI00352A17C5
MLIALDYDLTYSLDPDFWDAVIVAGMARGHRFVCVTGRDTPPGPHERQIPMPVVCAPSQHKYRVAAAAGYAVNVWIDDSPGTIEPTRILGWAEQ